jgi:hypothetical protein
MILWFSMLCLVQVLSCSWNYRFDAVDNHFNIVYPDKNAVYFGMILPYDSNQFNVFSHVHPESVYFSIQIYEQGGANMHYNDIQLLDGNIGYNLTVPLQPHTSYFALFRIYVPLLNYWGGIPPKTLVDGRAVPLCDIDYEQQGNIYTNLTYGIHNDTGTVCAKNEEFLFMDVPAGSLVNADANYMIACVQSTRYRITVKMPEDQLRYASISLVSTSAPRPTVWTEQITSDTTMEITIPNEVSLSAFLYRQLLPSPDFEYSIANAKTKCYDYVENKYDNICIAHVMGEYYPKIERI